MPKSILQTTNFPYMLIEYTGYGKSFQRQAVNLEFVHLSGASFIGLIKGGGSPESTSVQQATLLKHHIQVQVQI